MPEPVQNLEPGGLIGNIVDDIGAHKGEEQRLPGGYHLSEEKVNDEDGVYVHHDAHDPLQGLMELFNHWKYEVNPGHKSTYQDKYEDWK